MIDHHAGKLSGRLRSQRRRQIQLPLPRRRIVSRHRRAIRASYHGARTTREYINCLSPGQCPCHSNLRGLLLVLQNRLFHKAVLRCFYAYFHNLPQEDLPYIKIPLHTVIKLTPKAYGCDEERFKVPIEAVDTHRPKPKHIAEKDGRLAAASPEGIADLSKAPPTRTYFVEEELTK